MTDTDIQEPQTTLLPGLIQRPPELGRIRMGEKGEKGAPVRLKTFRLTSGSRPLLEAAAQLYGGKVQEWKGAPDDGMWQLTTAAAELDIMIPASLAVIGQRYEFWQGGTLERGCDGTTESVSGKPCLCAAAGLEGADRICDIVTRLRVMLPRVPGLGVWRLDTSGYLAATTLPVTLQLLARLQPGAWIPAYLRAEQRSSKTRTADGKVETHRFVVPVLDLPGTTIGGILGQREPAQLEEGEPPRAPATAAEKAAARRAQLEAQTTQPEPAQAQEPALSLPRGQCAVKSPRGVDCRHPIGHEGEHQAGNVRWPTPAAPGPDEAAPADGPLPEGTRPGAVLAAEAAAIFHDNDVADGDYTEAPDPIPDDVQAGLALIPDNHHKGG